MRGWAMCADAGNTDSRMQCIAKVRIALQPHRSQRKHGVEEEEVGGLGWGGDRGSYTTSRRDAEEGVINGESSAQAVVLEHCQHDGNERGGGVKMQRETRARDGEVGWVGR
jgi:hypothetical protein